MDFESINSLNVRLNIFSGNLLPMTSEISLFSVAWKVYSTIIWLIVMIQTCGLILVIVLVPREILRDGGTVAVLVTMEVLFLTTRINARRNLTHRLIQQLNEILCSDDETMKSLLRSIVRPMKIALEFYSIVGTVSLIWWCCMPLLSIFKRTYFFYKDLRVPVIFARQPFSTDIFLLKTMLITVACTYLFVKKVALDVYMINFVLLVTVQYRYIARKLAAIFCDSDAQGADKEHSYAEREMKALCRRHNSIML